MPGGAALASAQAPAKTTTNVSGAANDKVTTFLYGPDGSVVARASFEQKRRGVRVLVVAFGGLTPGFHGLHIHSNDNPDNGSGCNTDGDSPFSAVDGHLKSGDQVHGQHDGDLPMLLVDDQGRARLVTFAQPSLQVEGLAGRAVTIHSGPDNYSNIPLGDGDTQYTANSQAAIDATAATGNAGSRVACGILE